MKIFGNWLKDTLPAELHPVAATPAAAPVAAVDNTVPAGGNSNFGQGRKILVVDDSALVVKTFELKLKSCGFEVLTANEGSEAVSTARQARPDLILLDINFQPEPGKTAPPWDGFYILQWLGRFQEVAAIPVIVITSGDAEKLRPRALAAGAVDFFRKPVKFDDFLAAVDRILASKFGPAKPAY